jgi:ligand-binding SRPBCC domain-containing protein
VKTETFVQRTRIAAPAAAVFMFHARPDALERLTPPWERVEFVERTGGIRDGARVVLIVRVGPFRRRWVAVHSGYVEGRQFRDTQVSGPFARWEHTHTVEPDGPEACYLEDRVDYALPFGAAGRLLGGRFTRGKLERLFAFRHRVTAEAVSAAD